MAIHPRRILDHLGSVHERRHICISASRVISGEREPIMEIIEQLADLDAIEVSSHGLQQSFFQARPVPCCTSTYAAPSDQELVIQR